MFEELVGTKPDSQVSRNRSTYFIGSSAVLFLGLAGAIIFSLFAADLDINLNDMDMVELIAPVETQQERKLPELDLAPQPVSKPRPGPAAAPVVTTRQAVIARIDETPRTAPATTSTVASNQKARPVDGYLQIGDFDNDGGTVGTPGRGTGGTGIGEGGLGDGTVAAKVEAEDAPPPPPVKPKETVAKSTVVRSLGVVNGRATVLPKPAIPATAKVANIAGTVAVQVLIDEKGNVLSANAVSGNVLLRESSERAAKQAKFIPTLLSGEPVRASGVINYHFAS